MNRLNSSKQVTLWAALTGSLTLMQCQQSPIDYVPEIFLSSLPQCGQFHVYYGDLHNHTALSDGGGTPEEAYEYARNEAKLDFFGLSEHCYDLNDAKWARMKAAAVPYNNDTAFVTFHGFEWSSDDYGHVTVTNTEQFCSANDSATRDFSGLCTWLTENDGVAFFNHPNRKNLNYEFNHFETPPVDRFVGIELWNESDGSFGFARYYTNNNGFFPNDNYMSFYDEALNREWKIGAGGGNDNHAGNWGNMVDNRLAVLSKKLCRDSLFAAMKAKRFYSTLDKNLVLSFRIDGKEMGSTVQPGTHTMEIEAADRNEEVFEEVVLFNRKHERQKEWHPDTPYVEIHEELNVAAGDYFYIMVQQDDMDQAVSSPIWVE